MININYYPPYVNPVGDRKNDKSMKWKEKHVDGRSINDIINNNNVMYRKTNNTGAFKDLSEPMQLRHVKFVAEKYGIDLEGIDIRIERDETLIGMGIFGSANPKYLKKGRIHLFPDAFQSEDELAKTIFHEKVHIEQFYNYGYDTVVNDRKKYENEARELEKSYFKYKGWSSK